MSDHSEEVRKVYVRDIKAGDDVHTVFRVTKKQKMTSRGGKDYLALVVCDRTGELEARAFDGVDTLNAAFNTGDYVLIKGKTTVFHHKPQIVVDGAERLDPEPIDPKEFEFTGPRSAPDARHEPKKQRGGRGAGGRGNLKSVLHDWLAEPGAAQAVQTLVNLLAPKLEAYIDARIAEKLGGGAGDEVSHALETRPEVKTASSKGPGEKAAPRESKLPKEIAFKPFSALTQSQPAETAEATEKPAES